MADTNYWHQIETIIDRALDLPEAEQRRFIKKQCGEDTQLEGEVTLLLKSISDSEGWLEDPGDYKKEFYEEMAEDVQLLPADRSLEDTRVGAYIIREELGQGGMGTVYRAERTDSSFDHQVAIKMIRSGHATQENIQRFRHEQRILAGLNHPGIARLYNGGVTEDGVPYIIMEYVNGTPIDNYCKKNACSLAQKISLFEEVLEALRYAHENLVIHRDLKPANILVDTEGNIKILDFGISKLLQEGEELSLTQTGAHLLTPRYAAPEQITQQNITTATDLYALGMVFYQLLAGMHPFDFEGLSRYEMGQTILNKQPPKPSKKVTSPALAKKLKGDLDAIALKAIRKEPEKRYRVADTFLEDLKNYQHRLPVSARKDTTRYRSQKFFQRHKQGAAIAAGIILLLITIVGFYSYRITQERNQAEMEANKAENVSNFLMDLFEANDPTNPLGKELTARELLLEGRKKANKITDDEIKANMLSVIGQAYFKIGFSDSSLKILKRSRILTKKIYGEKSLEYASLNFNIGIAHETYADLALPFFRESYKIRSSILGENNPQTAESLLHIGQSYNDKGDLDSAKYYIQKSIDALKKTKSEHSPIFLEAKNSLATLNMNLKNYDKAENIYLELVSNLNPENTKDSLRLSGWYQNLAWVYIPQKEFDKALPYLEKSLKITESIYGPGHTVTLRIRNDLAGVNKDLGNLEIFKKLSEQNIEHTIELYGFDHKMTCQVNAAFGIQLTMMRMLDEGEKYLRDSIKSCSMALGKNHTWTAVSEALLAANLEFNNKSKISDPYFDDSYSILQKNAATFDRVNKRQISIILQMYRQLAPQNQQKIQAYSKLIKKDI